MDKKLIEEINKLAKKKREKGLTSQEQTRQKELYRQYLAEFRQGFDKQLDNIDVKTPDGKVVPFKEFAKKNDGKN